MPYPQSIEQQQEELEIFRNIFSVAAGVWRIKDRIVNMYIVSTDTGWVLVDAGLKTSFSKIKKLAAQLFGADSKPDVIVLTHGHLDHTGALKMLAEEWDVPVMAHRLELPYLTGQSSYPPTDPTVGGGILSLMSWTLRTKPIELGSRVVPYAPDGSISSMPGWRWVHTPGHSPGHVSFYRAEDECLIAGDAFVTTDMRKLSAMITQRREMHGPPPYGTTDWRSSAASVRELAKLKPAIVATGHGHAFYSSKGQQALQKLARHFYTMAVPKHGRYVPEPALADENGVYYVPGNGPYQKKMYALAGLVALGVLTLGIAGGILLKKRGK